MSFRLIRFRPILTPLLSLLLIAQLSVEAEAQVSVVSSIRPLQFIAAAIVTDSDTTHAIESDGHAHAITLTPQDRLQLQRADIVLWIDPEFEIHLADVIGAEADEKRTITVTELADVTLLRIEDDHLDPHIWLDPQNAIAIARRLTQQLAALVPTKAAVYQGRLHSFETDLAAQWTTLVESMRPLSTASFGVYHDAYGYFESAVNIQHSLVLLDNPEVQPSVREVLETRDRAAALDLQCIILEPDSTEELVDTLVDQRPVKRVTVDLLGYDIPVNERAYLELMIQVTEGFQSCVSLD